MHKPKIVVMGWEPFTGPLSLSQAIGLGFEKEGYGIIDGKVVNRLPYNVQPGLCEAAIVFGFRPPTSFLAQEFNRSGVPVLVGELGYLKRAQSKRVGTVWQKLYTDNDYFQVSLNKLCWLPPTNSCPGDRFKALDIPRAKDVRKGNKHILVMGQTVGDAQHNFHIRKMVGWLTSTIVSIRRKTDREIVWRPHPKTEGIITGGPLFHPYGCDRVSLPSKVPLEKDLEDCHAVVTINSTGGNFALLQGIPVFCEEFCMYAEVANTDISNIEHPEWYDTEDYFNRLAWCQWTKREMVEGIAVKFWERYLNEYKQGHAMVGTRGDKAGAGTGGIRMVMPKSEGVAM